MIVRDEKTFEDALLSDDGFKRIQARASDAAWVHNFGEWVSAEVNRPDFNPIDLMGGTFALFMSLHASVPAHFIGEGGGTVVLEKMKEMLDESFLQIFSACHKHMAASKGVEVAQ